MKYPDYLVHYNPNHDPKTGRFDFAPGTRTITKGTEIYRVSNNLFDQTYDNKKYVSLTKEDHDKWKDYLGKGYAKQGTQTYDITYEAMKDLKIAPYTLLGDDFIKKQELNDIASIEKIIKDTNKASEFLNGYMSEDLDDMLATNFAAQTDTGKLFVKKLIDLGYDGIEDYHGRNTSEDPIIIFDPDKKMRMLKTQTNNVD